MFKIGDKVRIKLSEQRQDYFYTDMIINHRFFDYDSMYLGFSKNRFELVYRKTKYYFY